MIGDILNAMIIGGAEIVYLTRGFANSDEDRATVEHARRVRLLALVYYGRL